MNTCVEGHLNYIIIIDTGFVHQRLKRSELEIDSKSLMSRSTVQIDL